MTLKERAPAKINLYLHVLRKRADAYHDLESLVAFTEFGDEMDIAPSAELSLSVHGPTGRALEETLIGDNLVTKAARQIGARTNGTQAARILLTKHIPVAAGLGGGSADAAAALRVFNRLWAANLPEAELEVIARRLGADIPACVRSEPAIMSGSGEILARAPIMPPLDIVIAHTREPLLTADVFKALSPAEWSGPAPRLPENFPTVKALCEFLARARNDLEPSAIRLQGKIFQLLTDLRAQEGCLFARMSGSGAACFGIFASEALARPASEGLLAMGWWSVATRAISKAAA